MRDEDGGPCGLPVPSGLGSEPGSATEAECALLLELDFLGTGPVQVEGLAPEPAALFLWHQTSRPGISIRSWVKSTCQGYCGRDPLPYPSGQEERILTVVRLLTAEGREVPRCQGGSACEVIKGSVATILETRWDLFQKDTFPSGGFGSSVSFQISCAPTCPFLRVGPGRPAAVLRCGWGHTVGLSGRRVF